MIKTSAVAEDRWTIEAPCRIFDDRNQVLAAFKAGELERDVVVVVYRNHQPKLVDLALRAGARVNLVAVLAEFAVLAALHVKTGVEVERAATAVELRAQSLSLPGDQIDTVALDRLHPHDVAHRHAFEIGRAHV